MIARHRAARFPRVRVFAATYLVAIGTAAALVAITVAVMTR